MSKSSLEPPILQNDPLWFPSRNRFDFNPAVPDRQLWAIGMVAVQWGMLETLIDMEIRKFIEGDDELLSQYKKVRNLRDTLDLFQSQIELKSPEPLRSNAAIFVGRIRNVASQRHQVMHRLWGGGMSEDSWNNPGNLYPETDGALLRQSGDKPKKTKSEDGRANIHWALTFNGIRKIATDIATLNRDISMLFSPPLEPPPAA
ncbi:hypothetical protein [Tardiphaga sp. 768_D3_N2_1]|uniref:hypothetical protein n=1 Tax=Tardiphaga sp. 768_D3_N2_1 TaxID=3240783 RepID=UPI003F8B4369